jgi:anaerobic magnesium-protoporphyrin IX monomethyl ester cyclase
LQNRILLFFSGRKTVQKTVPIPLSILAVAGPLIEAGYPVDLLDSRITSYEGLDLRPYAVVGISSVTGRNMAPAIRFARKVRREAPWITIVWGGIHVSALPEQSLESGLVDIAVLREGDRTFLELVERILQGSKDYGDIAGLAFRRDGEFVRTGSRKFLEVEKLGRIPYHLLDPQAYGCGAHMTYISSRGCPHTCSFCYNRRHNESLWRAFSAERVLEDLDWMVREYRPRGISFSDDNFFVSQQRVSRICEGILKKGFGFTWGASCRTDYLAGYDREFIRLLVSSGLRTINIGVEAGSQRMLDLWCGNKNVENHYKATEKMAGFPVDCSASFMMGYPGETDQDLQRPFE